MDLDDAARVQLDAVVRLVDGVLGEVRVGTYLHGSAVAGGLRPASDLDLLVVTARALDDRKRRALLDGLLGLSGRGSGDLLARSVELTVVVQAAVRPWRYPPTVDFRYGDWLRSDYAAGFLPGPEPHPDLALVAAVALAGDRPLNGPSPREVLDPVPPEDVVAASLAGIPGLLADLDDDTRNVVLTLARVWTTVATGEVVPKDVAADRALAQLPSEHRPVLEHVRDLYRTTSYAEETWSDELRAQVPPLVHELLRRITPVT